MRVTDNISLCWSVSLYNILKPHKWCVCKCQCVYVSVCVCVCVCVRVYIEGGGVWERSLSLANACLSMTHGLNNISTCNRTLRIRGKQTVMVWFQHIPPFLVLIVQPCHILRTLRPWGQSLSLHGSQHFNLPLISQSSVTDQTVWKSLFLEKSKIGFKFTNLWGLKKKKKSDPETDEKKICFLTHADFLFFWTFPISPLTQVSAKGGKPAPLGSAWNPCSFGSTSDEEKTKKKHGAFNSVQIQTYSTYLGLCAEQNLLQENTNRPKLQL